MFDRALKNLSNQYMKRFDRTEKNERIMLNFYFFILFFFSIFFFFSAFYCITMRHLGLFSLWFGFRGYGLVYKTVMRKKMTEIKCDDEINKIMEDFEIASGSDFIEKNRRLIGKNWKDLLKSIVEVC